MIDFAEIVKQHAQNHGSLSEVRRCPDQFVGVISEIERARGFADRISASERPPHLKCVLLILESPHISEFGVSPGPAKGATGRNIIRYLSQVPGLEDKGGLGLVLVNAVQYQCSLGRPTSEVRDAIFFEAWSNGGRVSFESRLSSLYLEGDCVVNCCTRGNSRNAAAHLRIAVHCALTAILPAATTVLRRNHPSSWHIPANRFREWPYAV